MSRINYFSYISDNLRIQHVIDTNLNTDGKYYQPHTHDYIELTYVLEADGYHNPEDREYKLRKHDLVITAPYTFHRMKLKNGSVYERDNLVINNSFLENINVSEIETKINVINCISLPRITDIFKKLDYYRKNLDDKSFEDISIMLVKEIFYNLSILNSDFASTPSYPNLILTKAIDFINTNLFDIKSVSDISRELFVTDSYLYEIFKKHLKTSPKKYINSKRLYIAKNEISLGRKPTEVFSKVGFSDYTSFYRNYTALFGYPPSKEIQEENAKKEKNL